MPSVDNILADIRQALFNKYKGSNAIDALKKVFKQADDDGNLRLSDEEFEEVLSFCGIFIPRADQNKLFRHFDVNGDGTVSLDEFQFALKTPPNSRRSNMIAMAWDKINADGDRELTVADLEGVYNASGHPKVATGECTEEEAMSEYLNNFDSLTGNNDGVVTWEEWTAYYSDISAGIPSDEYFVTMMENVWKIREDDRDAQRRLTNMEDIVREKCRQKSVEGGNEGQKFESVMKTFDTDEGGYVSQAEFVKGMRIFGLYLEQQDVNLFYQKYDTDGSGGLNYAELKQAVFPQ
jgi:Ca2+-binding EF-hand superfamily protein